MYRLRLHCQCYLRSESDCCNLIVACNLCSVLFWLAMGGSVLLCRTSSCVWDVELCVSMTETDSLNQLTRSMEASQQNSSTGNPAILCYSVLLIGRSLVVNCVNFLLRLPRYLILVFPDHWFIVGWCTAGTCKLDSCCTDALWVMGCCSFSMCDTCLHCSWWSFSVDLV